MYGRIWYGTYVLDGIAVLAVRYVPMDEHTRIWSEPLSDSERWIIEARCADPTSRDTGKWMRHLLTCYDALAVRTAELEQEVRDYQRQSSEQADEAIRWRVLANEAERERDNLRRAFDNASRVIDESLPAITDRAKSEHERAERAEAALRHIAAQPDSPGAAEYMRTHARAALGEQPPTTDEHPLSIGER